MAKLKLLSSFKRYQITVSKSDFLQVQPRNCQGIKATTAGINYFSNEKPLNVDAKIVNRYQNLLRRILLRHIGGILLLLLTLWFFATISNQIRSIAFTNPETYDQAVYDVVNSYLAKKWYGTKLSADANAVSAHLRQLFPEYAWLAVRKSGARLLIDVENMNQLPAPQNIPLQPGDLVAAYDGIILTSKVETGVLLVSQNQAVKKGDILVSGNLQIMNGGSDYTAAQGAVFATTLTLETLSINKQNTQIGYTGNVWSTRVPVLFNKSLFSPKVPFTNYEVKIIPIRSIGRWWRVNDFRYYEVSEIVVQYTKEEALTYAMSVINKKFNENRVDTSEKIVYQKVITIEETASSYVIKLVVKAYRNIAVFQAVTP